MSNINHSIDKMVKEKFLAIYNESRKKSKEYFYNEVYPRLEDKDPIEKVVLLNAEKSKLSQKISEIKIFAYRRVSGRKDDLLKVFANRSAILSSDDTEDLSISVYLFGVLELINLAFDSINALIPKYTYEDFLMGKRDVLSEEHDYFSHFRNKDDILKIEQWRREQVVGSVLCELEVIIKRIQENLRKSDNPEIIIKKDLEHYHNNIKGIKFESSKFLIKELSVLSFMRDYDFKLIDSKDSLATFNSISDNYIDLSEINPTYLKNEKARLDCRKTASLYSSSPIIFYSIEKVSRWIEEVIEEGSFFLEYKCPEFDKNVSEILNKAKNQIESNYIKFLEVNDFFNLKNQEKENVLYGSLDGVLKKFNSLLDYEKQYYYSMVNDIELSTYKTNSFFYPSEQNDINLFNAAIVYYGFLKYIKELLLVTGKSELTEYMTETPYNPLEAISLISNLVLDNDLQKELVRVYKGYVNDMFKYNLLPMFAYKNIQEELYNIFLACIDRLSEYLDGCEQSNKILFIQSRLRDLRIIDLKNNSLSLNDSSKSSRSYTSMFKKYLEIEAEFIKETKDVSFFENTKPINSVVSKNRLKADKASFSFGYKTKDTTNLKKFILELNRQLYFLKDGDESVENLLKVLTSKDLSGRLPKVYFNCDTTQLYYIFNKLKPYFNNLTFTNVEKSRLFFTKNGTLLKAQNLSSSKVDLPKNYKEIDQAFTLLQ